MVVDQVIVSTFPAPSSYTGEDLAEIGTHGNPIVMSGILGLLFSLGVKPAEAGEFTRRAFLNGKMDLLDVEALGRILQATSRGQATIALNQLEGAPAKRLILLRKRLIEHLTLLEAGINFPEEAIDDFDEKEMADDIGELISELSRFHAAARQGSMISQGLPIVIIGRPNTGKSSLLNALIGRDRAIVTDIPGTTRDTLEENWTVNEFPVIFVDTAGLHEPGGEIERLGIERTRIAISKAFTVIGVFDNSGPMENEDLKVVQLMKDSQKPIISVLNKCDLAGVLDPEALPDAPQIRLSALSGEGVEKLVDAIDRTIRDFGLGDLHDLVLLGAQQLNALQQAIESASKVRTGLGSVYHDLLSIDLNDAVRYLGMITGETVDINTLDLIFEKFCIGK